MPQSAQVPSYPVVEAALSKFAEWLHRMAVAIACRNRDCLSAEEFAQVAHELGISSGELSHLVQLGPHAADELPKMMAALNIDAEKVAQLYPLVMRDLERVCSVCAYKRECARHLAEGDAGDTYEDYCGNATVLTSFKPSN